MRESMAGMILPLIALAIALPQSNVPTPKPNIGSELYKACQAFERTVEPKRKVSSDDIADSQYCLGYIDAFGDSFPREASGICTDEHVTIGTLIRVYLAYMDKNPKLLDANRESGLALALADAYPCPAK